MRFPLALAACLLLVLFPIVSYGEVWNYADDFSITQNPNGAWSYGWRGTPGQPMSLYTDNSPDQIYHCDLDQWRNNIQDGCPMVGRNPHDYVVCGYPPHAASFHPGPAQQSVVRWTAPGSMQIQLTAHFTMLDIGSAIVRIYKNGSELFSRTLGSQGQTGDYAATLAVQAGDVIDCAVDPISFHYSTTGLDVVLTTVGPPQGACCFPSGGCLVGSQASCVAAGGNYVGDGVPCDPDPCGSTPVNPTTWGHVKSLYR